MGRRRSLESSLCLLIVGLLFALLLAIGHVMLVAQRASLIRDRTDRYETVSRILALTYTPFAKSDNESMYRQFTSRFMSVDRDITYVMVMDSNGAVLFADTRKATPYEYRNLIGKSATQFMQFIGRLSPAELDKPVQISVPIVVKNGERGRILIGFGSRCRPASC